MRLLGVEQTSCSPSGPFWRAITRLRLPLRSLESSKSSVLANQFKGAVTIFLIVPKREESSGWRFFKGLRRWLEGELDDAIVKEQQQMSRVTVTQRLFMDAPQHLLSLKVMRISVRVFQVLSFVLSFVFLIRGQSWRTHGNRFTRLHHRFQYVAMACPLFKVLRPIRPIQPLLFYLYKEPRHYLVIQRP
jgi:hypothetical protein